VATYSLASGLFVFDKENQVTGTPVAVLESIAAAGFRETELMAEGDEWQTPGSHNARQCREALERLEIFPHTIHTPMSGVNLASSDEGVRIDSVARIADAMQFLGELGGRTAIVHPTGRAVSGEPPYALENIGAAMEHTHRSVTELVKVAEETGVRIALENLPNTGLACRPLMSMQELRAFITDFPSQHVGLCLDTGHACISGLDPAEQARIASERLYALHIQDVDGQNDCHWVPGHGVIDWSAVGAALLDIGFDGAWTIEALSGRTNATAEQVAAECAALCERWEVSGMS
jgi:sugar phosphate isomerase/epimerase